MFGGRARVADSCDEWLRAAACGAAAGGRPALCSMGNHRRVSD